MFNTAAARNLHSHNRNALYIVVFNYFRQLFGIICVIKLGTADQRYMSLYKLLMKRRIRIC